jgi:hypothetical protein
MKRRECQGAESLLEVLDGAINDRSAVGYDGVTGPPVLPGAGETMRSRWACSRMRLFYSTAQTPYWPDGKGGDAMSARPNE